MIGYENVANKVIGVLRGELGEKYKYLSVYGGRAVSVRSMEDWTDIYIRVIYRQGKFIVDFSSVQLDETMQRKGYFTRIINKTREIQQVNSIIVSSILTQAMRNFVIKNNFKEIDEYNTFELKCR